MAAGPGTGAAQPAQHFGKRALLCRGDGEQGLGAGAVVAPAWMPLRIGLGVGVVAVSAGQFPGQLLDQIWGHDALVGGEARRLFEAGHTVSAPSVLRCSIT